MIPFILHCQPTSKKHSKGHSVNIRDNQVWDNYFTKELYINVLLFGFFSDFGIRAYDYVIIVYLKYVYIINYFHTITSIAEVFNFSSAVLQSIHSKLFSPLTYT